MQSNVEEANTMTEAEMLFELQRAGGEHTVQRLRARLAIQAEAEGLIDIAYCTFDSPVGTLLLAATGRGLVRVAFASEGHDVVLMRLAERVSPRI